MSHEFTDEQLMVANHAAGHALVNAVAGSGKTTTMVELIARRISAGVGPDKILAVMFNKQARVDFEHKLAQRLDSRGVPKVRTFNALGEHLYQRLVESGQLPKHLLITNPRKLEQLARSALKTAWVAANGQLSRPSKLDFENFLGFITLVKADVDSALSVYKARGFPEVQACFVDAFLQFEAARENLKIRFYDDQLAIPIRYLLANPDQWKNLVPRFELIVVDEFQDVSPVQYAAIVGIAQNNASVVAVGDDDQSIYGFRGAIAGRLSEVFEQAFHDPVEYVLSKTFRFGHEVACFASHLIANNTKRFDKLTVAGDPKRRTSLEFVAQSSSELSGVIPIILPLKNAKRLLSSTILVRYKANALALILELAEAQIPFHVYGGLNLLEVPAIAALTGALSIASSQTASLSVPVDQLIHGLVSVPTLFLKGPEIDAVVSELTKSLASGKLDVSALRKLSNQAGRFDARSKVRVEKRAAALEMLASGVLGDQSPEHIVKIYMALTDFRDGIESFSATHSDALDTLTLVDAFVQVCAREKDVKSLLSQLDDLVFSVPDAPPSSDHIGIRTIHSVKGSEFPVVIVAGLATGSFPRDHEDIEEERRLAYVAFTRAIERLVILHPADPEFDRAKVEHDYVRSGTADKRASQFLFEGCPAIAARMARALAQPKSDFSIPAGKKLAMRYASEAGIDIAIVGNLARAVPNSERSALEVEEPASSEVPHKMKMPGLKRLVRDGKVIG